MLAFLPTGFEGIFGGRGKVDGCDFLGIFFIWDWCEGMNGVEMVEINGIDTDFSLCQVSLLSPLVCSCENLFYLQDLQVVLFEDIS